MKRLLSRYDYDYIIGSVHYLGAWPFDNPRYASEFEERDLREVYRAYFKLVAEAARTGLFHAIGHLDLPKVMGYRPPRATPTWPRKPCRLLPVRGWPWTSTPLAGVKKPASFTPAPSSCSKPAPWGFPWCWAPTPTARRMWPTAFPTPLGFCAAWGTPRRWCFKRASPGPML